MRIRPLVLAAASLALLCAVEANGAAPSRDGPNALSYGAYLNARLAAEQHDLADAAKFFRQSLDRDPDDSTLLTLAFFYSASAGNIDEAADLARRMVAAAPDHRAARLVLAIEAMKRRDWREARSQIDKTAKGPYVLAMVALTEAWAAAGAGDEQAALDALKSLRGQPGSDATVAFHKATILEYLGKTEEADAAYGEAMKTESPSPRLIGAYGRFLERNRRGAEAAALYDKLATSPSSAPIVGPARARLAKGERPDPLIKRPQDGVAEALFGMAIALSDESGVDDSVFYLRLVLYLNPDFDLANILLGDRLETMQKLDDAIAAYRKVPEDSPYHRLAAVQIAGDEARLDHTEDAIRDLKALAEAEPGDIGTWTALGDAYRSGNRFAEAAGAYDKAIATLGTPQKKDWVLYYARAISRDRANDWAAAEADLKQALTLSPDEPQALNYLGYSWVEQGRNIPEALTMLERALALKPYDGYILDSVGWAYYRLGRYDEAAKKLEEAILQVPGDPTINDHYGDALWKVGRKLDARFQWNHAIAFGAEADQKSKIEQKLQTNAGG